MYFLEMENYKLIKIDQASLLIQPYKFLLLVNFHCIPYKRNIWRTLYLANEGKNRVGEKLNWRLTLI